MIQQDFYIHLSLPSYGRFIASATQEEIMQMCCPEFNAGMMFLGSMPENSVVLTHNVRRFSNYNGYQRSFRFGGEGLGNFSGRPVNRGEKLSIKNLRIVNDSTLVSKLPGPTGQDSFKPQTIISMDASMRGHFIRSKQVRDIRKAAIAFRRMLEKRIETEELVHGNAEAVIRSAAATASGSELFEIPEEAAINAAQAESFARRRVKISTGKWGCGEFGGEPLHKFLQQLCAAMLAQGSIGGMLSGGAAAESVTKKSNTTDPNPALASALPFLHIRFSCYGDEELLQNCKRLAAACEGLTAKQVFKVCCTSTEELRRSGLGGGGSSFMSSLGPSINNILTSSVDKVLNVFNGKTNGNSSGKKVHYSGSSSSSENDDGDSDDGSQDEETDEDVPDDKASAREKAQMTAFWKDVDKIERALLSHKGA